METKLMVGAYKTNITPPLGVCMAGNFKIVRANNILDDLFANALVVDDGITEAAIISVDIIGINSKLCNERILPEIERLSGIKKENIILAATHTHCGPGINETLPEVFGEVSEEYVEVFIKQIISAVLMAQKQKQLVSVGVGKGKNENHVFNRRLRKPNGSIVMNWVENSFVEDCEYSGPVDPEMVVARFDNDKGNPIAMVINYGNHNNAASGGISSDISGYMTKMLQNVYGSNLVVIFLLGPCGNTNWINHKDKDIWSKKELYKTIGTGLAGTVLEIIATLEYLENIEIGTDKTTIEVMERPYNDYDCLEDHTFGIGEGRKEFFEGYRKDKEKNEKSPLKKFQLDINAISIGDSFTIVTNPTEPFCDFGIEIKQKSHFKYTMVSELTNGKLGYVPTRQAFNEGGYEVRKVEGSSYLEIDTGERIVETSIKLINSLRKI